MAPHAQGSESLSWGMTGVTGCWDWRTGHELTLRCVEYEVLLGHPGGPVREGAEFLSLQMRGKTGPAVRKPDVFKCFENRAQQSPSDGEGSGSHGPGGILSRSRSLPQSELHFTQRISVICPLNRGMVGAAHLVVWCPVTCWFPVMLGSPGSEASDLVGR